jgi:hypothetical protein
MSERQTLHRLIDELPEEDLSTAERVLRALSQSKAPRMPLDAAPFDEEPETPEERAAVAEARAQADRGELIPQEELERKLGLR